MFKARGQPGHWYGYVEIPNVGTFKINARHVGERQAKHFEGSVSRHLKADQQKLPLVGDAPTNRHRPTDQRRPVEANPPAESDFQDDELPETPF